MAATLFDVSERANVSTATVSRVINGSELVKEATRSVVMKAVKELGYKPSYAARSLVKKRTDTLGVIFPSIDNGFFAEVLKGIYSYAAKQDYHLVTGFSHGVSDEQKLVERFLLEGRVDTLILMDLELPDAFIKSLSNETTPIVLLDKPSNMKHLMSVSMDNQQGMREIIRYLTQKRGFKNAAVITGPAFSYDGIERITGCQAAAAEFGLELDPKWTKEGTFVEDRGYEIMSDWLKNGDKLPDVIIAHNDAMAFGALTALREKGLEVPRDVALVGFDDAPGARQVGLTTIQVPMREMGEAAARVALGKITGMNVPKQQIIPTSLVVRTSCGANAITS